MYIIMHIEKWTLKYGWVKNVIKNVKIFTASYYDHYSRCYLLFLYVMADERSRGSKTDAQ